MKVDHPRPGELSPLKTGFVSLDCNWAWVIRDDSDDSIVFTLVGGRLHDCALLMKSHESPVLPVDMIRQLLRVVRDECMGRGILRFLILHDPTFVDADLDLTLYNVLEPYVESRVPFHGEILCGSLALMPGLDERSQ